MREWIRHGLLAIAVGIGSVSASAQVKRIPAEDFFRKPAIDDVSISPNGKRLAVLVFGESGRRILGVMDLDPVGKPRVVASFSDADVTTVAWVNDDRLVLEARQVQQGRIIQQGGNGTFAVNHDGSDQRHLISWRNENVTGATMVASRILPYGWFLDRPAADGTDDVFVERRLLDTVGEFKGIEIARLDTKTRTLKNMSFGLPEFTHHVEYDGNREPRLAMAYREGRRTAYWREATGEWRKLAESDYLETDFEPWYIGKNGEVVVATRLGDVRALHNYDPTSGKIDPEALVQVKGFDVFSRAKIDRKTRRLMGVDVLADRVVGHWFDPAMQRLQRSLDAALPAGRTNTIFCGECETTQFFVIASYSDRHPGEYFLFDKKNLSLQQIGAARPWIEEATQGQRSFHRYEARDGVKVPVYVTHPAGAKADAALPAVVLVHNGPYIRGASLDWTLDAQFLASRGYRVLQPEFRGSRGYGHQHFKAGWKEWGGAMQNDLADAVGWAVKQGLVDKTRVCIMGTGYGGFAALMGPISHPGTYRCAVSFAGMVDAEMLYSVNWIDLPDETLKFVLPVIMGDRQKDADRLAAASPLKRASEIKVPVLLAHGGSDWRVPLTHAERFASAAEKAGVKLERVSYPEESYKFFFKKNEIDFYQRVETFLKASLSTPD